ncbi:DUF6894 family protein [Bradyrhizobium sp. 1200_D9_N1_1]|uniref:DUF6894 family protein n=1 Tax=Bradyrhizobium sp. 1200_D9_N1_1 TaxID=3239013 RepID=UPI003D408223
MTRFFFHAHGGISVFDDVGLDLPDIDAAQKAAIELIRQILNEEPDGPFWQDLNWRVEVTDSPGIGGQTFLIVQFLITRTAINPTAVAG